MDPVRIQVNRDDWNRSEAILHADLYATAIGRIPKILRLDLDTATVHDGMDLFGGGSRDILIHHGHAVNYYIPSGNLEETLMHEGAHVSLDHHIYGTDEWNTAVELDNKFVSDYAMENPLSEDVSETYIVWFATRYMQDRFTTQELEDWEYYMGYRFAFFDSMSCGQPGMMSPW